MRIEIWSDVVCPWCYIGKRRLETALADFAHADDVEIVYRSYLLDPEAPSVPDQSVAEVLGQKYGGGPEAGRAMIDQMQSVAAAEGLPFRLHEAQRVDTVDAHRLLHLAYETGGAGMQSALKEALLSAYFTETVNVADPEALTRIATGVGLTEDRVREVLAGAEYADAVDADIAQAAAFGATGVPFFVVDRKYGVSGAQSPDVFTEVLERAWREAHPAPPVMIAGDDAAACGPDGCAL